MKIAALDLGSNTFLCLIAEITSTGVGEVYADQVQVVRLGQELDKNKYFHSEALQRARKTLSEFSELIKKHKPEKILAMATSAARDATNKEELFKMCAEFNIPLEIIPGNKEAQITYQGATSGADNFKENLLVLDIGGGSTEFIIGQGLNILFSQSLNLGCVRLTERFLKSAPHSEIEIAQLTQYVQAEIGSMVQTQQLTAKTILAVAGTPTTLAAVELGGFDEAQINGYKLTFKSLTNWLHRLLPLTTEQKINLGFPQGRADVMCVGLIILIETMKAFNLTEIQVSTRGVRYGVAIEAFNKK